jgi:hypothetical protein
MIIWNGLGILVPIIGAIAFFIGALVAHAMGIRAPADASVYAVAEILAGGAIGYLAHHIESLPGEKYIEKSTGREFSVGHSAGSLFFVPTRHWAFIVPAIGLILLVRPLLNI